MTDVQTIYRLGPLTIDKIEYDSTSGAAMFELLLARATSRWTLGEFKSVTSAMSAGRGVLNSCCKNSKGKRWVAVPQE